MSHIFEHALGQGIATRGNREAAILRHHRSTPDEPGRELLLAVAEYLRGDPAFAARPDTGGELAALASALDAARGAV